MARRAVHRLLQSAIALVLTMAVFGSAVQVGRSYWYCTAMRATMSHACCGERSHSADAQHAAELVAPECCQSRSLASLDVFVPNAREHELPGQPLLAQPVAAELTASRPQLLVYEALRSERQTRPPKLRAHARLMVFQI